MRKRAPATINLKLLEEACRDDADGALFGRLLFRLADELIFSQNILKIYLWRVLVLLLAARLFRGAVTAMLCVIIAI
jgi:hypothetical protein